MKISIISPSKKIVGGVERFAQSLASGLSKRGFDIDIVSSESLGGFSLFFVSVSKWIGLQPVILGFLLGRKAKRSDSDLIVTNGLLGWNIKGKKIINVQHGTYARSAERIDRHKSFSKFFVKRYIWGFFEKMAVRRSTVCVAVSEETRKSVQRLYKREDVVVIPNGVDTNVFKPNFQVGKKEKQGIFVGRFEYAKGEAVVQKIQKNLTKAGGHMVVAEHLNQPELIRAYQESSFFVLPSLHEGCSFALLEAMSCGLPVFVSSVGSVVTNNFPFKTYGVQDMNSMIEDINNFIYMDTKNKVVRSTKAREYVLKYHTIDSCVEGYYQVIINL